MTLETLWVICVCRLAVTASTDVPPHTTTPLFISLHRRAATNLQNITSSPPETLRPPSRTPPSIQKTPCTQIGIVGLPNVGKSTLFNVLTRMGIPAENFPFCTIEPNAARGGFVCGVWAGVGVGARGGAGEGEGRGARLARCWPSACFALCTACTRAHTHCLCRPHGAPTAHAAALGSASLAQHSLCRG